MEKNKNISLDNDTIINFLGCLIPIIIIAMLTRAHLSPQASNEFIANILFGVIILTGIYVYMALMQIIEKLTPVLTKNFFNKSKIKEYNNKNEFITAIEKKEISEVINKRQKKTQETKKQKLKTAIKYTQEEFTSYVTAGDLIKLCEYVQLYSEKENLENIKPINIKELTVKDLKHFGWNLWNHFDKKVNQENIALFLKKTFENKIGSIKTSSLKGNLTIDGGEGIIKIKDNLTELDKVTID
ncbi:hypothetical protein G1K63_03740 [Tenacibaculum finnmarkense]|uniref:hypothetical protein n=1 Tax=Tenacibaculum finnmarkense TaxID=2781243 RepID=UPI001EFAFBD8|nr:hypothetical protein [Tenacibaculum finnmarkense]MCG8722640.1 hypothetical protein [Tenacibaculum finnmarkense]